MSALAALSFANSGAASVASPNSALREQVLHRLQGRCRSVQQVFGGAEALAKLEKGEWQVLFLDPRLPDLDTEELLAIIHKRFPGIQVIVLNPTRQRTNQGTLQALLGRDRCRGRNRIARRSQTRHPFLLCRE